MPGRAKSLTKKVQEASSEKITLEAKAVAAYLEELEKKDAGLPSIGAQAICNNLMLQYTRTTRKVIKLNHSTIIRHAKGLPTKVQSTESKAWLAPQETTIVIDLIIELGNRGFPLSHRRLKEVVDGILIARLGTTYPIGGVGKQWTSRFIEKHSDRIQMSWASNLDTKRGRAVNPHTHKLWAELLGGTIERYEIVKETTYGSDEIGCSGSTGQRERVMGAKRSGPQYQQIGGDRENITVIVTICADGTSIAPTVIFKGKGFQIHWKQENPADASYVSILICI
jgi:hypothetical protein